jgi:hypothetical protein
LEEGESTLNERKRWILISLLVAVCLVASISAGYATDRVNLVHNKLVTIVKVSTERIHISYIFAFQEGDKLLVSGTVKRRHLTGGPGTGHVDIAVMGPDGSTIKESSVPHIPRIIPRREERESRFTARIPVVVSKGSVIRISYVGS